MARLLYGYDDKKIKRIYENKSILRNKHTGISVLGALTISVF